MESRSLSRRKFVAAVTAAGALALVGPRTARGEAAPVLRVRKSASQLPESDPVFTQYAHAVRLMHQLPADDPRNWVNQAKIHADRCAHGTPAFCHWHRHYLTFFEQICGELLGDPTFALPYWDWSYGTGLIPPSFYQGDLDVKVWKDSGKYEGASWGPVDSLPLRAIGEGVGVQSDPARGGVFTARAINEILQLSDFGFFYGQLEGGPHNTGHVVTGFPAQGKPGHIGSGLSPLDPLFWLHHCNVDRLWAQWQLAGNATPALNERYDGNFVDANGKPAGGVTSAQAVDFAKLGYTYEPFGDPGKFLKLAGLAATVTDAAPATANLVSIGRIDKIEPVRIAVEARVPIEVPRLGEELGRRSTVRNPNLPPLETIRHGLDAQMLSEFGRPAERPTRILARLRGVVAMVDRNPVVNVFVNCPYLRPETPYADPHYAGTFSFFQARSAGGPGHDHGRGTEFYVDLTGALRGADLANLTKLNIQLMALPPKAGAAVEGTIQVGSVELLGA